MKTRAAALLWTLLAALCPASACADIMTVTLLGTGTPRPEASRSGAAVLVEAGRQKLLFDVGRGAAQQLSAIYTPYQAADKVFITHMHYDHTVGLADLFLSGWLFGRREALRVWGPPGVVAHTDGLAALYAAEIARRHAHTSIPLQGARFETKEIKPGTVYEHEGLRVEAIRVDHGDLPAFGYRVEYAGRVLVVSGDTRYSESLVARAGGADLLLHEVATASASLYKSNESLRNILDYHTSVEDLIRMLKKTQPRMTLLTHVLTFDLEKDEVMARIRDAHVGEVRLADDLTAIDIGERLRVYKRPQF